MAKHILISAETGSDISRELAEELGILLQLHPCIEVTDATKSII